MGLRKWLWPWSRSGEVENGQPAPAGSVELEPDLRELYHAVRRSFRDEEKCREAVENFVNAAPRARLLQQISAQSWESDTNIHAMVEALGVRESVDFLRASLHGAMIEDLETPPNPKWTGSGYRTFPYECHCRSSRLYDYEEITEPVRGPLVSEAALNRYCSDFEGSGNHVALVGLGQSGSRRAYEVLWKQVAECFTPTYLSVVPAEGDYVTWFASGGSNTGHRSLERNRFHELALAILDSHLHGRPQKEALQFIDDVRNMFRERHKKTLEVATRALLVQLPDEYKAKPEGRSELSEMFRTSAMRAVMNLIPKAFEITSQESGQPPRFKLEVSVRSGWHPNSEKEPMVAFLKVNR